eukprot:TRINITY_DN19611_c0_g1_i1.p1 TRINITY_DN19611_c0_g1~~TRINITY_DN19611_c0_g1_i1.p1  ORF type:complete len:188 (+),score=16.39 TRINITY_DN19611_c0_g1_i1:315-878(+)
MLVREDRWFAAAFRKVVPDLPGQNAQLGKASVRGPESVRSSSGIRCHVEISSDDTWQAVQRTYMHLTDRAYDISVSVENGAGESEFSDVANMSTSPRPSRPSRPQLSKRTSSTLEFKLTAYEPTGASCTRYGVSGVSDHSAEKHGSSYKVVCHGLEADTAYHIAVFVSGDSGESDLSEEVVMKTSAK